MRKFIAKIMLAVFILNCIPGFGVKEITLQAAGPYGLSARFDNNLTKGRSSSTPVLNTTGSQVPEGHVLAQFSLESDDVNIGSGSTGSDGLTFTYLQDANTKIQLTIARSNGEYTVYFDPHRYVGGSWVRQNNSSMLLWDAAGTFLDVPSFIPRIPSFQPTDERRYDVKFRNDVDATNGYKFMATRDTGFTIQYNGYEYYFLIDGGNQPGNRDTFLFTTNGFESGRIYNFYVYSRNGKVLQDHYQVSTGLNRETLDYIPFANPYTTTSDKPGSTSNPTDYLDGYTDSAKFKNNKYLLDYNDRYNASGQNAEELPGTDTGLAIRFDDPVEYMLTGDADGGAPLLRPISLSASGDYEAQANFHMNDDIKSSGDDLTHRLSAQHNDFHKVTGATTLHDLSSTVTHPNLTASDGSIRRVTAGTSGTAGTPVVPARFEVKIHNLLPNILFHNVFEDVIIKSSRTAANSAEPELKKPGHVPMPLGTAFTFLDYRFVMADGEYELHLTPYGTAGTYFMVVGGTTFVATGTGATGETVVFNVPYRTLYEYVIYFFPGITEARPGNVNLDDGVYSERTEYSPDLKDWWPGSPKLFKVDSYQLKPLANYTGAYGMEGLLDMTVSWDMARTDDIKWFAKNNTATPGTATFNYTINKSLDPESTDPTPFADVVVTVTENAGNYELSYTYTLRDGTAVPGTGGKSGIDLDDLDKGNGYVHLEIEFEDIPATRSVSDVPNEDKQPEFYYPRIYFINGAVETKLNTWSYSGFDSITLDDLLEAQLPPLKNFRSDKSTLTKNSFETKYTVPSSEIKRYLQDTPAYNVALDSNGVPTYAEREFSVNFYISQNETLMQDFAKLNSMADRLAASSDYAYSTFTGSPGDLDFGTNAAALGELRAGTSIVRVSGLPLYDAASRANFFSKIAAGADFDEVITLLGLDPNQKYYMYVTLAVENEYTDGSGTHTHEDESMTSNLLGVTTTDDPDVPGGEDWRPPAPVLNVKDVGADTATVYWDYAAQPDTSAAYTEEYYYEVIRTKNEAMDAKHMDNFSDLGAFYTLLNSEMSGVELAFFKTDETLNAEGKYTPYIFDGSNYVKASASLYELMYTEQTLEFIDKSLNSNQIYFYYVRTVRVVNGTPSYSIWNYTNCTTDSLAAPINLKIELEASYDKTSEVVLSFDAPLSNIAQLGVEYELEYAIKKDIEEFGEPIVFETALLRQNHSESDVDGYIHFLYKITGLEAGTQYSFRVRLKAINSTDRSAWSNIASTRTTITEEDAADKRTADAWMEYYRQHLALLHKNDYWTLQDNKTNFSAVYRPTMFPQVISKTADSQILLPTGVYEENYIFTYYVPVASMKLANEAGKGFVLAWRDMEVVLGPGTVDTESNETVFDIAAKLNDNSVKDYYIMFKIEFTEMNTLINGQEPISDQVIISLELVGSRELTSTWDSTILQMYTEKVASEGENQTVRNRILTMLQRNETPADVEKYVLERIATVRDDLIKDTNSSHKSNTRYGYVLDTLDKSIIIAAMTANEQHIAANGYRLASSVWNAIDTFDYKGGKGFYTNLPGTYVFAGVVVKMPGIDGQPNAGTAYTIVSKYGLTDFLGIEGNINVESPATRNMLLSSAARMMGAPKGSDPVAYFKTKGYAISGAGLDTVATAQESVYVVMAVYETKTGTKMNTVQIRNFALTANIAGLDDRYKQSVRAAFELGIYTNTTMQPRVGITIKELLDMLTALDKRANL